MSQYRESAVPLFSGSWKRRQRLEEKAIGVRVVHKAGYDKVIAANKGKVVVVDCWATWCVPCRKAFPKTVELSKAYADKDVVVVSLSFDEPKKGQAPEAVKRFLAVHEARFENLISSLDISADGADVFAIPEGALPHFKIYGKDGKLFKAFEVAVTTRNSPMKISKRPGQEGPPRAECKVELRTDYCEFDDPDD